MWYRFLPWPPLLTSDLAVLLLLSQVVLRGVFQNCGQNCIGLERIYVHADIYDGFVSRCAAALAQMRQGPTFGAGAEEAGKFYDCGALVMPAQLGIVQARSHFPQQRRRSMVDRTPS